jgi:hypothetical protein
VERFDAELERRQFLKGAATVAWATPLILTVVGDNAGAQSCVPLGAPCDACVGVNCCIQGNDPFPCCCSDADDPTTCAGVCRTHADCEATFPSDDPELVDPDSCWAPGGTASVTARSRAGASIKAKR